MSQDGSKWIIVDRQSFNECDVTDVDISPMTARYVRFMILESGADGTARIGDIEIYGRKK